MCEEKKFKRIGVLTSGGDAPGMNAAVRAVTRAGILKGVEIVAIYEGYKGLLKGYRGVSAKKTEIFNNRKVSNIINLGGTILYSDRCDEFMKKSGMDKAIENCKKNEIDGIITIGGDGTFRGARDLTERGIPCIGIPATIDNDITSTDYSIGFDTAMNTVIQMVDRLRDTCESHARCNVVEVMGRNAGYIALQAGIAVGASAILTLEVPYDIDEIIKKIIASKNQGKRNFIVIIAEGVDIEAREKKITLTYSEDLKKRIQAATDIETKFARLAHVVRGGSPSLRDRLLASQMGYEAVELLLAGKSNLVVCEQKGDIVSMDISEALALDAMYKNKLKLDELKKYSTAQVAKMKTFCDNKHAEFEKLYKIADDISH